MTDKTERPQCVACGKTFSDDDVKRVNFHLVSMSMSNGPSLAHNRCPGKRSLYE